MRAEQPHGLAGGGAHRRQAEPLDQRLDDALRRLARMDDARGDAQRPGRSRHQNAVERGVVMRPVAGLELVLDQPVGGVGIGHPQQRLGQHHQRQALLGGERIGVQEILDAAEPAGAGTDRLDQPRGAGVDARLGPRTGRRRANKIGGNRLIRRRIGRAEGRNVARLHRAFAAGMVLHAVHRA